jgi:organic hydroperoxide reductase OsmC/OhrA
MPEDEAACLNEVVKTLERDIEVTAAVGLDSTAELLRMARLDLLMHIHGISDEELQALIEALSAKNLSPESKIINLAARKR